MNVGSMTGVIGSAAGSPLSQTSGSETERAQKQSAVRERQAESETRAEKSAGIGETEQDQGPSERDADGRRFWEAPPEASTEESAATDDQRQVKDLSGDSGNSLDLTG